MHYLLLLILLQGASFLAFAPNTGCISTSKTFFLFLNSNHVLARKQSFMTNCPSFIPVSPVWARKIRFFAGFPRKSYISIYERENKRHLTLVRRYPVHERRDDDEEKIDGIQEESRQRRRQVTGAFENTGSEICRIQLISQLFDFVLIHFYL